MKKLLLFVIACTLGLFGTVNAQETITIGNGEQSNYSLPLEAYYLNTYSQQSYTKAEIEAAGGEAGTITSIAFHVSAVSTSIPTRSLRVYMNNIDDEQEVTFSTVANMNYPLPNLDGLVFEGDITFADGWVTIPFATPFTYNGNHLLITVMNDTNDSDNLDIYFYVHSKTTWDNDGNSINWASNGNSSDPMDPTAFPGGWPNSVRNNIQLTFAAAGEGGGEEPTPEPEPTPDPEPGDDLVSTFEFNFNDGSMEGWRAFQGEGNGEENKSANWQVTADGDTYYAGYENTKGIYSYSWNIDDNLYNYPYNYVVTTQAYSITAASELSWYMRYTYTGGAENDKYQVVASTDGVDFNIVVWEGTAAGANENTISLAEYAGQTLYLGFYHYTIDQPGDAIVLDNIVIKANEAEEGGEEPTPEPEPEPVAPAAPVVEATVTETTVTLTWEAVENATYYNIYTPNNYTGSNVYGLEATTYTFEGLTAGTEYCFEVSAVNDVDESEATEICATTTEAEIEEPTGDMCVIDITLTDSYGDGWNGNTLTIAYGGKSETISFEGSGTSYKEKSLSMEIPSGSHVTATYICTNGYGYPQENGFTIAYESGEVIVSVEKNTYAMNTPVTQAYEFDLDCTPKAPATPVVKAVATGGSTIVLTITSAGAESYNIYNGTETVATGVTENPYTVEGLAADTEYCFTVVAVNEIGDSEVSEAACATTFAEGTVIVSVGEGNIAQMSAPIYNAGPGAVHSLSQQIYTAEEIGIDGNADIFSISFHHATGNNNVRNIVVYMQNVDADAYTDNKGWFAFSESDKVYEGEFNFGMAEDWVTIDFQNKFEYKGGNVAVTVYDKTGAGYGYTYDICDKFYSSQINEWRGLYYTKTSELDFSQLSTFYGTTMNTGSYGSPANVYYINNIKLRAIETEGEPEPTPVAPAAPQNVEATANGFNSIIVTWDAVENADYYIVYKDGSEWTSESATTATINGLEMGQEYCFAVQAVNDGGESELSETVCVSTESLPENQVLVGTATTKYYSPFLTVLGGGSWFETIYKAEEIGKAGNIAEIAFSYKDGAQTTADINIYLTETTKTEFANPGDLSLVENLTLVYSGTGVTLCDSAWETFVLDTPFNYSGENNLLLVVTTANTSGANNWNCYTGDANTVLIKDFGLDTKKPVMMLTYAEGGEEPTPTFTHRLESVGTAWGNTAYTFDEENANRVVAIDEDGIVSEVTYNEAGQIASAIASYEDVDEDGNPVEVVISGVEYEYDENGVWTSYTETSQSWFGGTVTSETVLSYDAEGRLVSLTSEEYARTIAYNEAGLISEVVEGYIVVEEEGEEGDEEGDDNGIAPLSETEIEYSSKITFEYDAEGRLVKKDYYFYDAYETMEFYWGESEVYTYDENGNCVKKEAYEVTEENELRAFPYSVAEYIYDLTINNEDVYSFEYPHFAFINYVEPSYVNILVKEMSYYSYYDEDVEDVVSHSYEVTAYNYNPAVVLLPLTPMNLTAEVLSATEVELAWAGFPDAESFTLYQGETVLAEGLEDPYYTVENLEMGVEYCFAVMATNSVGNSEVSETVCVTIELPAAPANLVAEATSETEIALTWDEVPGIWSYNVYQVVETAEETTYELLGEAWWTEYTVTELTAETEYSFVVKAVSNVGESAASNVATATTLAPPAPTVPAAPVVTGSFEGDKVILEWEAVEGAFAYNLYYGGKLLAGPFEDLIVEIQVPEPGTYCFTVTAVNEVGESEHSEEVCVTVTVPEDMEVPAAPVLEVTLDGNKAILSWEEVENATYYDVYIEAAPGQGQYLGTATMEDLPISMELPQPGEYCFYVVAGNLAGMSEPSNVACVNYGEGVEENEASFNIYPNPVSDNLVIETEATIEAVTIYTVTGVAVYSEVDFNDNTIDVSDFANGVYVIKVRTENGEAVQRFIKK